MTLVHVVTSCTDRKLHRVPERLRLGAIGGKDLRQRVERWTTSLDHVDAPMVEARALYGGEHWVEFLRLLDSNQGSDKRVQGWVISAGYGLIPVTARVKPYAATFSRDSVNSIRPECATWSDSDWWTELAGWFGPEAGAPRTLADLGRVVSGRVLVTASPTYLRAVGTDLAGLIESRPEGEVTVFSSKVPAVLRTHSEAMVAYDSRLQVHLGGSKIALNIRTLSYALLKADVPSTVDLRKPIQALMDRLPRVVPHGRAPSSDSEVTDFIRQELSKNPVARPTPLLRQWRSMHRACEQARFRSLFGQVLRETQFTAEAG